MSEPAGTYQDDWKPTAPVNANFKCRCGSNDVWFRNWDSSCGGFEDVHYQCRACGRDWWVESADA